MKTFSLLSRNAHPGRVRLSRPQVAARWCVTEPCSRYWKGSAVLCSQPAGCPCAEPAWGRGCLHWAKTNTLCWNPDSTHGQNSVSEWWCGCLDCSHDLAWRHAKDPGMHPRCFLANKSSKNLEHHRVRCQYTAPPWRGTGSSPVLATLEPVKLLCTMLLKSRILSRRAKYLWEEFQFSEFLLSI